MHLLARTGLALLGLALAAPVAVWADPPASADSSNPHQHRRGLFGKQKLCAECQRAKLQAQGINIPPPPALPQGVVTTDGGVCTTCQQAAGQEGVVISSTEAAPGYAVVGGDSAPGYAVVGGQMPTADPSPIGVVQGRPAQAPGRPAGTDRSVMQASVAPAPDPVRPAGSNRPQILSHLFGISAIGRDYREAKQRRKGEAHAAIRYDQPPTERVTDLPASKVYGK